MDRIGKYTVIDVLGRGGFGAVYLCEDNLEQKVAVKVFDPKDDVVAGAATSANTDAVGVLKERFKAEAITLRRLSSNPYIVDLYDFDQTSEGVAYYVMPYLGQSLVNEIGKDSNTRSAVADLPPELRPRKIPVERATQILAEVLEAMRAVHREGLVHRDLKPANILFDPDGKVQVCDFGIAKLPDADHSQSGVGMGSRNYMSPEQRDSAKHVTAASDVYSIGVIAYRMMTGTLPMGRYSDPNVYSPEINDGLNDLIIQALSHEPQDRPRDAEEFYQALKAVMREPTQQVSEDTDFSKTWVDDAGVGEINDELKPLRTLIENLLLEHGEIPAEEQPTLAVMGSIGGLSEPDVEQLVDSVAQTHQAKLRPMQNFLREVDRFAENPITATELKILITAGELIGWDETKVRSVVEKRGSNLENGADESDPTNEPAALAATPDESMPEPETPSTPASELEAEPARDELRPLEESILRLLLEHGEIPAEEQPTLDVMASIAGLSESDLAPLIESVTEANRSELRPIQSFLKEIEKAAGSPITEAELKAIVSTGKQIGWDETKVRAVFEGRGGKVVIPPPAPETPRKKPASKKRNRKKKTETQGFKKLAETEESVEQQKQKEKPVTNPKAQTAPVAESKKDKQKKQPASARQPSAKPEPQTQKSSSFKVMAYLAPVFIIAGAAGFWWINEGSPGLSDLLEEEKKPTVSMPSLEQRNSDPRPQTSTPQPPTPSQLVRDIQSELNNLEIDVGSPDGLMGPRTRDAIRQFEAAAGLPQSGVPSESLLSLLKEAVEAEQAAAEAEATRLARLETERLDREKAAAQEAESDPQSNQPAASAAGNAALATPPEEDAMAADIKRREERAAAMQRRAEQEALHQAESKRRQQPGYVFKDCNNCPEMVVLTGGSFTMGSDKGRDYEKPAHRVFLSKPFAMSKYEITFAEYDEFARAAKQRIPNDQGWGRSSHPVMNVTWNEANAYAAWLSEKTSQKYRLPSEAEWEYAARAGTTTEFSFGSNESSLCGYGNGADLTFKQSISSGAVANCEDGYVYTAPVGSYAANAFGLHDMHGNVWEWTADCWKDSYEGAPTDGSASSQGNCGRRVVRGGSWNSIPASLRSANRNSVNARNEHVYYGIRLVQDL